MLRQRAATRCIVLAICLACLPHSSRFASAMPHTCGTPGVFGDAAAAVQQQLNQTMQTMAEQSAFRLVSQQASAGAVTITVPVYFHVLREDNSTTGGDIPDAVIHDQMKVLNEAYNTTGFRFKLENTTRTTNASWFTMDPDDPEFDDMTRALHRGHAGELNLYTLQAGKSQLLGWSGFPWWYAGKPHQDGVFINRQTLPGLPNREFLFDVWDLGKTAVHETGHWLGLLHPDQVSAPGSNNSCAEPNDYVADTPQQQPAFDCRNTPTTDTCPNDPGYDSYHNIMNGALDRCLEAFTPGQVHRMHISWQTYRAPGAAAYSPAVAPAKPTAAPNAAPTDAAELQQPPAAAAEATGQPTGASYVQKSAATADAAPTAVPTGARETGQPKAAVKTHRPSAAGAAAEAKQPTASKGATKQPHGEECTGQRFCRRKRRRCRDGPYAKWCKMLWGE